MLIIATPSDSSPMGLDVDIRTFSDLCNIKQLFFWHPTMEGNADWEDRF
jgi:hypothetical protein